MTNFEIDGGAKKLVRKLAKTINKKTAKKKIASYKPKSLPKISKSSTYKTPAKKMSVKPSLKKKMINSPSKNLFDNMPLFKNDDVTTQRTLLFFRFFMSSIYFGAAIFIYYQIFYKYFVYLEDINCNCATRNWKYYTLRVYFIYMIANLIADFAVILYDLNNPRTFSSYVLDDISNSRFVQFNALLHVFMIIIANLYIQDLYDAKCECSEHDNRDIFSIISILELFIYAFLGLRVFVLIFSYILGSISRSVY
jgi:hypothetical protein